MKINCSKKSLTDSVSIVSRAIPSRTNVAIMQCIIIEAYNGNITLTASNNEFGIKNQLRGEVIDEGISAIDAKIFESVVRRLPEGDVTVETDSNYRVLISCQNSKFNLPGRPADDFVALPEFERENEFTISQYTLKEVIVQTIFSISSNENNVLMTGVLFEIKGEKLRVAALDGHRIAIRNIELRQSYKEKKLVIPGTTLNEISRILSGEVEKSVDIIYDNQNVIFSFDRSIVQSRLIQGEYFDLDKMFRMEYELKVSLNRRIFMECIERSILLIKEGDRKPVIMNFTDDNVEMRISTALGSMNENLPASKTGPDLLIGFNPRFLIEALRVIDDDEINVYLSNSRSPLFMWDDNYKYTYVILPINFNNR